MKSWLLFLVFCLCLGLVAVTSQRKDAKPWAQFSAPSPPVCQSWISVTTTCGTLESSYYLSDWEVHTVDSRLSGQDFPVFFLMLLTFGLLRVHIFVHSTVQAKYIPAAVHRVISPWQLTHPTFLNVDLRHGQTAFVSELEDVAASQ